VYAPIERRKTYELVAENLLEGIAERRLTPGETLPTERELTESFRVGRSSVREALRMLESKGVIRAAGNGSFVVADAANLLDGSLQLMLSLERSNLRELFEVRRILEGELAALAAERRSDDDLTRMAEAIAVMDAALSEDDQDGYAAADVRFHLTVAEASGNRIAEHMMLAIRGVLRLALEAIFRIAGSPERSQGQHRGIMEAIAGGNADEARRRMIEHLTRVEADVADAALESSFAPRVRR
jgi:GntR family transcriptional repressor for pyruvate dehydrogenase complex